MWTESALCLLGTLAHRRGALCSAHQLPTLHPQFLPYAHTLLHPDLEARQAQSLYATAPSCTEGRYPLEDISSTVYCHQNVKKTP